LIGAIIAVGGINLAANQTSFPGFLALFTLSYGLSTGIVYSAILYHAWLFFPGKEGVVSGIVIAGFGIGGALFINVANAFINPNDIATSNSSKSIDPKTGKLVLNLELLSENLPNALHKITYIWIGIFLAAIILVIKGPK